MKIIVAAGGTAGHINPALAIAQHIKSKHPQAEIMFVGRKEGMEYGLVTKAGYPFCHMEVTGFQRRLTLNNIKRNFITVKNLLFASSKAKKIINDFKPDLVIGTGGYVSGPILLQAAKMGIRTAIHEQNAFAGVTNKLLSKKVDYVFVATEKAAQYMAYPEKCIVCGNPVREEISTVDVAASRARLGVEGKTVVLSFGGSLGARRLNDAMKVLALHNKDRKDIVHYHVVGRYDEGEFVNYLKENNIEQSENLQVFEYLYDIPKYMAAADILITRCGALTIAEIACMGKASILIPSPNVAENHQYHNGKVLADMGAAVLIEEKDLNADSIVAAFESMYSDITKTKQMGQLAKQAHKADCLDIIYNNLNLQTGN
ncbi:MAG: undecaprenyldiphospho-muramoylpentapeptide beta-N-acetylglucosaminyltransferase [Oscillospiraceae bacterium]|nr:undecaprenyldiphospho-muramoylpentapeptide beta-N-acetylglucosaminyltransferase [Oscillospiraceae bacterium]